MVFTKNNIIVVKIGSSNLLSKDNKLNTHFLNKLARQTKELREKGFKIVFVISGAVAIGRHVCLKKHAAELDKKSLAGIGQSVLTSAILKSFTKYNLLVSQILVTKVYADTKSNELRETTLNTIQAGIIPIFNENDVLSLNCFNGNDNLAAYLATLLNVKVLIILSNVDGLYVFTNKNKKVLKKVTTIDNSITNLVLSSKSSTGIGGMEAKLEVAKYLQKHQIKMIISNAKQKDILLRLILHKEDLGTHFHLA